MKSIYSYYSNIIFNIMYTLLSTGYLLIMTFNLLIDPQHPKGGSSTGAPGARPLFEIYIEGLFVTFDCITRIHFNCHTIQTSHIVYNMYFDIYSHYKTQGMCEGGIKTNLRPKEFYRAGTAPPILKFLDPPLHPIQQLQQYDSKE